MKINKEELTVRYTKGSGPGGQKKNKVETCCYIKHIPTGIEVKADGRSKTQNYETAIKELGRRLEEIKAQEKLDIYSKQREEALSVGRIRTYDYKTGIVKDHRTGKEAPLKDILNGKIDLLR